MEIAEILEKIFDSTKFCAKMQLDEYKRNPDHNYKPEAIIDNSLMERLKDEYLKTVARNVEGDVSKSVQNE